jgi:signal transduction histidine kinase
VPALEWQIEEFHKRTGLAYEFNAEVEELNLDKDQAIALFRIFQESLTNIARHAEASQVKAKIAKRDHVLWIEIADNGKGISAEALNATSKFGLLGMRERVLVFGGEVIVTGAPGQGTTVKIKVPISSGEHG